jgi:hypothetical protein
MSSVATLSSSLALSWATREYLKINKQIYSLIKSSKFTFCLWFTIQKSFIFLLNLHSILYSKLYVSEGIQVIN